MNARVLRWLALIVIVPCTLALLGSYAGVAALCYPQQQVIAHAPADLPVRAVEIASASGTTLHGWLIEGQPGRGAILLLHGVHANRLAMLARARFLSAAGYAVLLIDFQAHGESPGEHVTFGHLESRDAQAGVEFLRKALSGERVGAIGVSMGGAAALLAEPPLNVDALVLEQVYPTIAEALDNRLRIYLGALGSCLEPLLMKETSWHLGIGPEQLQPIDHIGSVKEPVLVIAEMPIDIQPWRSRMRCTPRQIHRRICGSLRAPRM
jgi:pimeloyl-ACP methyl ester carboxylesterase